MWGKANRAGFQSALRAAALVFVGAWLLSGAVRAWVPIWAPILVLLAAELEFVLRGRRTPPRPSGRGIPPGPEDADLGFGELVEDEGGVRFLPPPPRGERRRRRLAWLVGAAVAIAVVLVAARRDRSATWTALPADTRARAHARFTAEASRIAGIPVRVRCDDGYAFTGAGSDTLGIAFPRSRLAYLDPSICRTLYDLEAGSGHGDARTVEALIVLAHEAAHLGGERREGVTECLALQAAGPLGVRLGLSEALLRRELRSAFEARLAERNVIRAAYALPATCRAGGPLDRRPGDPRFPF